MNYWLSPTGQAVVCGVGCHTLKAIDIIVEKYEKEGVEAGVIDENGCLDSGDSDPVGFLERKGWLRYQGWNRDGEWIIHNRRPTKRQIEMMFELTGYFYK